MYISEKTAKKNGYVSAKAASHDLTKALRWVKRNPGQKPPAHIQKARLLAIGLMEIQENFHFAPLSRWMLFKIWFGAVPDGGQRLLETRKWLRKHLRLYLCVDTMIEHFVRSVTSEARIALGQISQHERDVAAGSIAIAIEKLFAVEEKENRLSGKNISQFVAETGVEKLLPE